MPRLDINFPEFTVSHDFFVVQGKLLPHLFFYQACNSQIIDGKFSRFEMNFIDVPYHNREAGQNCLYPVDNDSNIQNKFRPHFFGPEKQVRYRHQGGTGNEGTIRTP
jgi:hypothetical protein